jgi:hypothetical protein
VAIVIFEDIDAASAVALSLAGADLLQGKFMMAGLVVGTTDYVWRERERVCFFNFLKLHKAKNNVTSHNIFWGQSEYLHF